MKRILVIGSGGAGKSTFARKLGEITGIEVIHLDSVFWRPNWQRTPEDEWERAVAEMVKRESWILDGNFGGTRRMRIAASDTVILLDIPRHVCLYRVIKRTIRFRGRHRPDMADGCNEKVDPEFLSWIWNYPRGGLRRILEEMKDFPEKRFVVIRSARDAEGFLRSCKSGGSGR